MEVMNRKQSSVPETEQRPQYTIAIKQQMKSIVRPDCRVVFMSGNAEEHLVGGVQLPGELLRKPFSFQSLMQKLSGIGPQNTSEFHRE